MLREMFIAAFIAFVAVGVASGIEPNGFLVLAQMNPVPVIDPDTTWTWAFVLDELILGGIGLAGGFLSLIAIPFKTTRDAVVRVVCGGFFSCLFAGAIIIWVGLATSHPSIRMAIAGLSGFLSYPVLIWLGRNGLAWVLKRLGIADAVNMEEDKSPAVLPPAPPATTSTTTTTVAPEPTL